MRKQDIRAGVAYAYQRGRLDSPEPCVLVSTDLYAEHDRRYSSPSWSPAREGVKPGRNYLREPTGYPALLRGWGLACIPDADLIALMLPVTPDVLAGDSLPAGLRLEILTSLTPLCGPWEQVKAGHDERERGAAEQRRPQRAESDRQRDRFGAIAAVLAPLGISGSYITGGVWLPLDDAERLAGLLDGKAGR